MCGFCLWHGCDFSSYHGISGFRFLSESNENGVEMHFECGFAPVGIQTLTQSGPKVVRCDLLMPFVLCFSRCCRACATRRSRWWLKTPPCLCPNRSADPPPPPLSLASSVIIITVVIMCTFLQGFCILLFCLFVCCLLNEWGWGWVA